MNHIGWTSRAQLQWSSMRMCLSDIVTARRPTSNCGSAATRIGKQTGK
jgi:hypothetical protein